MKVATGARILTNTWEAGTIGPVCRSNRFQPLRKTPLCLWLFWARYWSDSENIATSCVAICIQFGTLLYYSAPSQPGSNKKRIDFHTWSPNTEVFASCLVYEIHSTNKYKYLGTAPQLVTVTTRIIPFLVGNSQPKPSFLTGILGGGVDLTHTYDTFLLIDGLELTLLMWRLVEEAKSLEFSCRWVRDSPKFVNLGFDLMDLK